MKLRIYWNSTRRLGRPRYHSESFGYGNHWHRYWFAGRLMVYLLTVRP